MKCKHFVVAAIIIMAYSCQKEENSGTTCIEGSITDELTGQPVAGVRVKIDAIKAPSSEGFLSDGKRENMGTFITDANGHYLVRGRIFADAALLEFDLNGDYAVKNYSFIQKEESARNLGVSRAFNYTLKPAAYLQINYKNIHPYSDSDFFSLYWIFDNHQGTLNTVQQSSCGLVNMSEGGYWIGKDVCGAITLQVPAEDYTYIYPYIRKNGIVQELKDSVYVKRNMVNYVTIDY